jgi:hypothetical protein
MGVAGQIAPYPPIGHEERIDLVMRDLMRHAARDALATLTGCDAVMAALRDRLPEPAICGYAPFSFQGARDDCEVWAEYASDGQIAAMLGACFERIGKGRLAIEDRKRLLVAIWNSLTPQDRKAFRDRVLAKE